ncbi:hypothetical protein CGMCC3_g7299 [Colletotrichum fructicola]|nr:uncharacterized protein CGMCC3_g7299 [Colletotrichum fructicola]KAE9576893.1 hypothetical protein CGMCC3_g7299 [Colletotrichum fructicola]
MSQSQDNHEVELAADDGDDPRSEIGSSIASSRTSLRDSIIDYRIENGRSYHRYKEGKYNLPNDDQENDRLESNHQLWLITLDDKLGVAPPCEKNATVGRVLDVGTGTGIWAIDFGDEHPEADVYGNDLSAVQPTLVPPNVKFEVDDIEDEWTYSPEVDVFLIDVRKDLKDRSIHAYWPQYAITGRKPHKMEETPALT